MYCFLYTNVCGPVVNNHLIINTCVSSNTIDLKLTWVTFPFSVTQVKRTPSHSINESIISNLNLLVVFKHALILKRSMAVSKQWCFAKKKDHFPMLIAVITYQDKFNSLPSLFFNLGGCDQKPNFDLNVVRRIFKMNAFLKWTNRFKFQIIN